MDKEVRRHLEIHWQRKQQVKVLPLAKTLTFYIICSILFELERGGRREAFVACFQEMIEGMWSVPINLPFTCYNCSLRASARVQNMLKDVIREKRVELERKAASPRQDLITCLLSIRNEDNEEALAVDEIVHNVIYGRHGCRI
ncbi:cytochrome P450 716B1-like isoform X1 [Carya illinoinensis]|uniref:cytochrome P450 716B1-like isoform X1 n=1 Tax=Carya illinoinensis TaxID=32201 RepID=UPI001C71B1AF|nr:cytochrome P450 716B1-like isoform X1 [Carya illinoinensis]